MSQKAKAQLHKTADLGPTHNTANITTTPAAIVLTGQDMPRVDSRLLAQHMEVQHKNSMELLEKHKADFLELGHLPFQTEVGYRAQGGGKAERFALLNEDQAHLLLTYSRNTATVRALKVKLVKAFSAARKAAEQRATEYLPCYHLAHDALKGLAPSQQRQQHLHMNVNKLLNKTAGIEAGKRGVAPLGSMALLTVGQMLTAQAAAGAGDDKTAYARIKGALLSLQTLLPSSGGAAAC